MNKEELIKKLDGARELLKELKWSDLREDEVIIAVTRLRVMLEDMFGIIKLRRNKESMPYIIKDK